MFAIAISPSPPDSAHLECEYERGEHARRREHDRAQRGAVPIAEFGMVAEPHDCREHDEEEFCDGVHFLEVCPVCGSTDVETEEHPSMAGESCGETRCNFCLYATTWADLSAVI
jgi:hypothetical protein